MAKFVIAILKWILMVWGMLWAVIVAYLAAGIKLGYIKGDRCTCGGHRYTSHGKLYGWMYR